MTTARTTATPIEPHERICRDCGDRFGVSASELTWYAARDMSLPRRCTACRHHRRHIAAQTTRPPAPPPSRPWLSTCKPCHDAKTRRGQ